MEHEKDNVKENGKMKGKLHAKREIGEIMLRERKWKKRKWDRKLDNGREIGK